jgi:hypothetical protein
MARGPLGSSRASARGRAVPRPGNPAPWLAASGLVGNKTAVLRRGPRPPVPLTQLHVLPVPVACCASTVLTASTGASKKATGLTNLE